MTSEPLRIALVQMSCEAEPQRNLDKALTRISEAAARGAKVICLQELFRSRYFCQSEEARSFDLAEPIPGPTTEALGAVAAARKVVVVGSIFERRTEGIYHNTAVVMDADGRLAGRYRKMHIPDDPHYYEKLERGEVEPVRRRQLQAWETVQRGHAIANGMFVAVVNRVGPEDSLEFWGNSFVVDPFGEVIARAGAGAEEILVADCNLALIEETRRNWPFLRDRRIDAYGDLLRRFRS